MSLTTSYEYKFVRLGEGRLTVRKAARETYQDDIGEPEMREPTERFVRKPAAEREMDPAGTR